MVRLILAFFAPIAICLSCKKVPVTKVDAINVYKHNEHAFNQIKKILVGSVKDSCTISIEKNFFGKLTISESRLLPISEQTDSVKFKTITGNSLKKQEKTILADDMDAINCYYMYKTIDNAVVLLIGTNKYTANCEYILLNDTSDCSFIKNSVDYAMIDSLCAWTTNMNAP